VIVGIETSTAVGSVAALHRDGSVEERSLGDRRNHAKNLATRVAELIDGRFDEVEAYALSIGPGSFTGLRIGLSFVKGLALVHPRPAVGVGSLEVASARIFEVHPDAAFALPLVDARRDEVFAALLARDGTVVVDVGVYSIRSLPDLVRGHDGIFAGGDGIDLSYGDDPPWRAADEAANAPSAADLVRIAKARFERGEVSDPQRLSPAYLQVSGAEQKLGIRADLTDR
jgi:tRNA threonylcarbamoyladenosine biosynthesis protein TsaB